MYVHYNQMIEIQHNKNKYGYYHADCAHTIHNNSDDDND